MPSGGRRDLRRERLVLPGDRAGLDAAEVADVRAAVEAGVGVDDLAPGARAWQPEPVSLARDRRQVGDEDDDALVVGRLAGEGEDVRVGVVGLDPPEARVVVVELPQGGFGLVGVVEVTHQRLHAAVLRVLEQVPVERALLAPLGLLRELAAHEQQLLAGVRPHERVERAQVGHLLPLVARHLGQQRALAVHDLIVAERQDEVLGEGVDEAERQLVVVPAPVDRILLEVRQRVVHPAHVPLEAEAEAAEVGRPRDARPGGRLLGRRDRARLAGVEDLVEFLQELNGVEILVAAELVRHPLALLARVVEVEHRGHGVDADAVGVVLAQPVEGVGDEEVADLVAAVVEDQRAPVGVGAAARVGVLVERRAVEAREREVVAREVRRHPVEDHAEPVLVQAVDKGLEVVG